MTNKKPFTLRMQDETYDKIGWLATHDKRSMTNYITLILEKHIETYEAEHGEIVLQQED